MQFKVPVSTKRGLTCGRLSNDAFALIDSVVASILLVIMAASLQSLFEISRQGIRYSNQLDEADREIHTVIDDLRSLGMRYHYCNRNGVVSTGISDCSGATPLLGTNPQSYYSPTSSDLQSFKDACNTDTEGDMNKDKILNGGNDNGSAGLLGALQSLKNSVAADPRKITMNYVQDNKESRRIKITLAKTVEFREGTRTLTRQYYFSPMLALWCP